MPSAARQFQNVKIRRYDQQYVKAARDVVVKSITKAVIGGADISRRLTTEKIYPPPSEEYTPPAQRTGKLAFSIRGQIPVDVRKSGVGYTVLGRFGTRTRHGFFLEFGTVHMRPRPFLRPALDQVYPKLLKDLGGGFRKIKTAGNKRGGIGRRVSRRGARSMLGSFESGRVR